MNSRCSIAKRWKTAPTLFLFRVKWSKPCATFALEQARFGEDRLAVEVDIDDEMARDAGARLHGAAPG